MVVRIRRTTYVSIRRRSPQSFPRLARDIETTIFRVIQEALTNVLRDASSHSARIEIEKQSDAVVVRVRDYGKGVPQDYAGRIHSLGLGVGIAGMRERVRQFGGELTVIRAEPGTLVETKLPLFSSDTLCMWRPIWL